MQAQDKKSISDIEKVYLHTDRSTYFVGEDLWYKAYNVRASNNLLFDNSNILYVELISPDSKIIARNKTKLEMGLGHGDFQLQDSLGVKPGVYQLRAYTNWNRNFGEDFVFKKNIEIIDVFESHDKTKTPQNISLETKTTKKGETTQNTFHIDFFPEGGSLLENVASVVGFKAVDINGNPIDIKGEIYDSDNELVTAFESVHDGMGKLQMLPTEAKKYYAKIKSSIGEEIKVELPNVLKQGYLLSFRTMKGRNIISISTNEAILVQNPNPLLTVVCKAKGISYLETAQTLTETTLSFELPKDKTPEGISQITLFDCNNKPQSERLIFIEKEQDLDIQLLTDKPSYQPNEKAIVSVSSKSKTGAAKSASFSLSVTDMNRQVEEKDFNSNICSYFLMESDIRGKVYHPGYYFDKTNPKRLEHLDNLLLTQGWRDFVWKTMSKVEETNPYKVEKGITISGRVKQLFADKPLVNNNITLALMSKKKHNIFNATTDSIGRFQFENLLFSGKTNMYLNTRDEKGKFRGEIVLDSIELAPIPVKLKKELIVLPETNEVAENVFKKFIAFGVKPENILKEVLVTATTKKKDDIVANYGNYGFADKSYIADEDTHLFINIYELIQQKIPGTISDGGSSVRFTRYEEGPIFIVDGRRIYPDEQSSWVDVINPSDVVKIDVITGAQATLFFGEEGEKGIIAIYTKPNTGNKPKKDPFQSIKQEIEGFYTARVFYSPDPEKPDVELDKKAAVRNTIYWNPYVHPDKTGNTSLNYYNTKVETKVKVALEGITATGIPVVKNTYYTIKHNQ
ncbi:hypothetical protein EOD40_12250 [Flavobacterium sufflavum]|uniref:TonB-dependent receptor plug domain-containing protein n=1 Tax=Flavobacterium sufflavum TaxID=1921138 RepID=A0A3S3SU93_9FLAO|nr:Plug domain-containing protein [Flavobacterium sufflavum]RVT74938.1 hypothetical protein EOD40_12250 [Flavobacterium sufflavum]